MSRKKELTVSEIARMGGKAAAARLTPKERTVRARKAAIARWEKRKSK